jgi:tyrosyl-tRNA synthetase
VDDVEVPDDAIRDGVVWLPRLLAALGVSSSNAQGRRLIEQGGVRIDGELVADAAAEVPVSELRGRILQVGRRTFLRLV